MFTLVKKISWIQFLYIAWAGSILGTLGSLVYSEILLVPICPLCWYQRIAMYPLVVIFAVGILFRDKKCVYYALPLIFVGFFIAVYQVLLQAGVIPNLLSGCEVFGSVSCAQVTYKLFGLVSIPQQALFGFGVIGAASFLALSTQK